MHGRPTTLAVLASCVIASWAGAAPRRVVVQPLGAEIQEEDFQEVVRALEGMYGFNVEVLPRQELPAEAWYAPRQRYRAEKILTVLSSHVPEGVWRVIGVTAVDISTTKGVVYDWGILGLGDINGRAGVISLFRCKKGARDLAQARERLAKIAVHEMGHTLGLEHCPNPGCLMRDAEGSVSGTDHEQDLCADCRRKLGEWGRAIPDVPKLPWKN
jgi:archaemetzincin